MLVMSVTPKVLGSKPSFTTEEEKKIERMKILSHKGKTLANIAAEWKMCAESMRL